MYAREDREMPLRGSAKSNDPRTHPRASNLTHTRYIPCRHTHAHTDFFIRALAERSLVRVLDFCCGFGIVVSEGKSFTRQVRRV
jgi:hypothetical protein